MTLQRPLFAECSHDAFQIVPEKRGPHHAKKVCSLCHKFLGWMPKPETVWRQHQNADILTRLSKKGDQLSEWERGFIRDLATHKNISPKQQTLLDQMRDKYLGKEAQPSARNSLDGEAVLRDRNSPNPF